jgi:esterase/lipase
MIWDFENISARRLFLWAGLNGLVGLGFALFGNGVERALGLGLFIWALVEGILAWFILGRAEKHLGKPSSFAGEEKEAVQVRRVTWVNNAVDVIIVAGGTAVVYFLGRESLFWQGMGLSVIIHGVFLFIFTMWHALRVPDPLQLPHLPLFTHPDHEPFLFEGGKPACLLVHGFPGTALEMRPLGQGLNEAGWTARGMRLPGFGLDLADVIDYNNEAWVRSIVDELKILRDAGHSPLLLVGYSFGGGLSIQAAARLPLDGLVLIAPVTWHESNGAKVVYDFARALLPLRFQPFQRIPIAGSNPLDGFEPCLPEIDFTNPEHVSELQHLQLPLYILDQIREVGRKALAAAPEVRTQTLLIQGTQDKVIQPDRTETLRDRLSAPITYEEVDGEHHLTMPHNPAFENVKAKVINFAEPIASSRK